MATPERPKHPELNGSEQHHDLKNDPGKKGDPDHTKDTDLNDEDTKKPDAN